MLRGLLDRYGLERLYAWGHPRGLEAGRSQAAFAEMLAALGHAQALGAEVMRVVSSNGVYRHEPHGPQLQRLQAQHRQAAAVAQRRGVRLAVENHLDFSADELLELVEAVGSPYLGITFDTGNFVRLGEDPAAALGKLGSFVYATHLKDVREAPAEAADG
ncbi:MAG: sugar phosphate isomerase/epimerase [Chloroflexi bacterium]|nr:sugar phosphate isomerase/epimerase [Chloroflexota bacterium]